jgi:hypothetical protein
MSSKDTKSKLEINRELFTKKAKDRSERALDAYNASPKHCQYCDELIPFNKRINNFCNRSCSTSFNNKKTPKRKPTINYCESCGDEASPQRKYCSDCNKRINRVDWSKMTYGEVTGKAKYQKNARVRQLARVEFTKDDSKCESCGYDKHVEVHHKKEISSHSDDTLITEINSKDNIMILCPNCHWEEHNKGKCIRSVKDNASVS